MVNAIELISCCMMYIPSFMKTGAGVQASLRFFLSDSKGCNGGITDGSALLK
jgi:hypothetical protein